jgi:hypothetical protein
MPPSVFLDRASPPGPLDLERTLGGANRLWVDLVARLAADHAPVTATWSWSGASHGWLLRLARKKATLVYLVPACGAFTASFALREPAVSAAKASPLPSEVLDLLERATLHREGRAVRLPVGTPEDVETVRALVAIKTAAEG